jgi:hypothetical protein
MTSAIKRRIAREWLIFLLCAVIGLFVAYYALYFHQHQSGDLASYAGVYMTDHPVGGFRTDIKTPVTCSAIYTAALV